ncbi:hypothetical protein, variant 1 [Exophiala oligosperma]|uniref:Uncharacterized protein n=1 Tax=Exophiala oligosperma TaxID=215243 RepID=A0A0D2D0P9_9EURO|nr:uncharacterized protein PV06_11844 [Exophiala oligosperma]XP_016256037.1 hypothetical protein, variant 1 [Exophiala oligosperma]KIW35820.1 hypothetical protein PV06_11844 [Exophiala oligosperma]KIW35821.1 hypothetical protein, variant 1 [Exophiala oligosperma]
MPLMLKLILDFDHPSLQDPKLENLISQCRSVRNSFQEGHMKIAWNGLGDVSAEVSRIKKGVYTLNKQVNGIWLRSKDYKKSDFFAQILWVLVYVEARLCFLFQRKTRLPQPRRPMLVKAHFNDRKLCNIYVNTTTVLLNACHDLSPFNNYMQELQKNLADVQQIQEILNQGSAQSEAARDLIFELQFSLRLLSKGTVVENKDNDLGRKAQFWPPEIAATLEGVQTSSLRSTAVTQSVGADKHLDPNEKFLFNADGYSPDEVAHSQPRNQWEDEGCIDRCVEMDTNPVEDATKSENIQELLQGLHIPLPSFGTSAEGPLSLTFSENDWKQPMIEIRHCSWLDEVNTILNLDSQITIGSAVPLEEAVLAVYHLNSQQSKLPRTHRKLMFDALRVRLLHCAILARIGGDKRRYFELFPVSCIGERIDLVPTPTDSNVSGYLCKWNTRGDDQWECEISDRGSMVSKKVDWKELKDESLVLSGGMGQLHQGLLRRYRV